MNLTTKAQRHKERISSKDFDIRFEFHSA
jgi:hypothetical protein